MIVFAPVDCHEEQGRGVALVSSAEGRRVVAEQTMTERQVLLR